MAAGVERAGYRTEYKDGVGRIFDFNLVAAIFGDATVLSRIIYTIVGICGLINIGLLFTEYKEK